MAIQTTCRLDLHALVQYMTSLPAPLMHKAPLQ